MHLGNMRRCRQGKIFEGVEKIKRLLCHRSQVRAIITTSCMARKEVTDGLISDLLETSFNRVVMISKLQGVEE